MSFLPLGLVYESIMFHDLSTLDLVALDLIGSGIL